MLWHCWLGIRREHLACKNSVIRCWYGYLSGVRCRLFAYGSADATESPNPIIFASFISRLVLPFWYRLTHVVLAKRPLNRCRSSSIYVAMSTIEHWWKTPCWKWNPVAETAGGLSLRHHQSNAVFETTLNARHCAESTGNIVSVVVWVAQ